MDLLYATAQRYLREHNVLSLATSDGVMPWVAPVFYASWRDNLVFLSAPHTLHCKNIALNEHVAASIQEDYDDWSQIKGFQIRGVVSQFSGAELTSAKNAYSDKFPLTGPESSREIADALDRVNWFGLKVKQILFIDNSRQFGHRDELDPSKLFIK